MAYICDEAEASDLLRKVRIKLSCIRVPWQWLDEKESIAMLGIAKALRDYKPGYPGTFFSYVMLKVEGEIKHFLHDYSEIVKPSENRKLPKTIQLVEGWKLPRRLRQRSKQAEVLPDKTECLTGRQKDVLRLKAQGLSTSQIAEKLGMDVSYVKACRREAQKRLGFELTPDHYELIRQHEAKLAAA